MDCILDFFVGPCYISFDAAYYGRDFSLRYNTQTIRKVQTRMSNLQQSLIADYYELNVVERDPAVALRTVSIYEEQANEPSSFQTEGYIHIEKEGAYQFLVESDDGGVAAIGGLGSVGDPASHSLTGELIKLYLKAGFYRVTLTHNDIGATQREDGSWTVNSNAFFFKWDEGRGGSPGGSYTSNSTPRSVPSDWSLVPLCGIRPRISLVPKTDTLLTAPFYETPVDEATASAQPQSGLLEIYGNPGDGWQVISENPALLQISSSWTSSDVSIGKFAELTMTAGEFPVDSAAESADVIIRLVAADQTELDSCIVKVVRNKCKPVNECARIASSSCSSCAEGTETDAGCIEFGLAFGRSSHIYGAPSGKVAIEADVPSALLYTPAVLRYNHPMMRKIERISPDRRFVMVTDELGNPVTYCDGVPSGNTSGRALEFRVITAADGSVSAYCETLEDTSMVYYNTDCVFDHLVTAQGTVVTRQNCGIDVILSADGSLRQIWAASEGLLDITVMEESGFVLSWYSHAQISGKDSESGLYQYSGMPIKTFTFERPQGVSDNTKLQLTERRGEAFCFHYLWTYIPANHDWALMRGTETEYITKSKARNLLANGNVQLTYVTASSMGNPEVTTEELSTTSEGQRVVGRTVNGINYMSGTRNASAGGRISSNIGRSGDTTLYNYDCAGRTAAVDRDGFSGLRQITVYEYSEAALDHHIDQRPTRYTRKLKDTETGAETVMSETVYTYTDDLSTGRTETQTQTVNGVSQVTIRRYYPVPAENPDVSAGRLLTELHPDGTMIKYEYSAVPADRLDCTNYADFSYTETITTGIKSNVVADHYFGTLREKSVRTVNFYNAAGDIVRTEEYVHYSGAFRLVSWVEHTYNAMHRIVSSTWSNGKTSSADWICTGPVFEIDTDGIRTDYTYDALKRCTSKVRHSPNGDITTAYTYDTEGRILSTTVSGGSGETLVTETTSQTYDAEGRPATVTDAQGLVTSYTYSADNLTTIETKPNGGTVITTRNLDGTIASITGPAVVPVYYSYELDAVNALEITTEHFGTPDSKRWKKTWVNGFGQTVREDVSAWNDTIRTTTHTYNARGLLVSTAETGKPTVTYGYDAMGTMTQETASDGTVSRIMTQERKYSNYGSTEYAQRETVATKCTPADVTSISTVKITQLSGLSNALESKVETKNIRSLSSHDTVAFDPETGIRTIRHTDPGASNGITKLVRDGLLLSETDVGGAVTTYTYDPLGRQLTATDGRGNTVTNVYNSKGQLISTTDGAGNTTSYAYSASTGELLTVTDAAGKAVHYSYDLRGNRIAEYGDAVYPVVFEYNIFGEQIRHTTFRNPDGTLTSNPDPVFGDTTVWNYDEASGLLTSKVYPDGKAVTYTYDVAGKLLTRTWARTLADGIPLVTAYIYNLFGDLTDISYSDGVTPSVSYIYNAMGMRTAVTDASGTTSYTYTKYREPASGVHAEMNTSFVIGRDNYGRVTSTALSLNGTAVLNTANQYNNRNSRITKTTFASCPFSYTYLANSNLVSQITTCNGAAKKVFTYEANRDLPQEIAFKRSNNALIAKRNYTYDALGRVAARTQTRGTDAVRNDAFSYNDRSELVSATLGTDAYGYAFDNIGNRITAEELEKEIAYSANHLNQYTAITEDQGTPFIPVFDSDGNQLTVQTATGVWCVTYNAENRPVSFTNGTTVVQCQYDHLGRRFEKKVTVDGAVTFHQRYSYNGFLQIAAFDVTTEVADGVENDVLTVAVTTHWDPVETAATRPLAFVDHSGDVPVTYFYTHDLTKNICEVLDVSGAIVTAYDYTPFGAVTASNSATPNTLTFSSEVLDAETALVYYNYRHYNPADGRWINRDPIDEQGGMNLYAMVGNGMGILCDYLGYYEGLISLQHLVNNPSLLQSALKSGSFDHQIFPERVSTGAQDGAPSISDQFSISADRKVENRHSYIESRFPKTFDNAKKTLKNRIHEYLCKHPGIKYLESKDLGVNGTFDVIPDHKNFSPFQRSGDREMSFTEKYFDIGSFLFRFSVRVSWDRQRYSYTGYIQAEDKRGATDPFIESSGRTWLAWGYDLLTYPTRLFVQHDVVLAKWNFAGNGCCIK